MKRKTYLLVHELDKLKEQNNIQAKQINWCAKMIFAFME